MWGKVRIWCCWFRWLKVFLFERSKATLQRSRFFYFAEPFFNHDFLFSDDFNFSSALSFKRSLRILLFFRVRFYDQGQTQLYIKIVLTLFDLSEIFIKIPTLFWSRQHFWRPRYTFFRDQPHSFHSKSRSDPIRFFDLTFDFSINFRRCPFKTLHPFYSKLNLNHSLFTQSIPLQTLTLQLTNYSLPNSLPLCN